MPRAGLKPWVKGESGNPLGCSKEVWNVIRNARGKSNEAIEIAYEIMCDDRIRAQDRLKACEIILERGLGKAPQLNVNVDGDTKTGKNAIAVVARQVFLSIQKGDVQGLLPEVVDVSFEEANKRAKQADQ